MKRKKLGKINLEKPIANVKVNAFFILMTGVVQLLSLAVIFVLGAILTNAGVIQQEWWQASGWPYILLMVVSSVIIGMGFSILAGKLLLRPYKSLVEAMIKVSRGDYSVRLSFGEKSTLKGVEKGFNNMAEEISKTEMLRSDFVNNFSHEFKTPIASIRGLLELLKREDLTHEKRQEYIEIIDEETTRLLEMSTKILHLSKIENEKEIQKKKKYNLSEQIRTAIVMLEKRWDKKNLELNLDFDEIEISGDEEMLMHVWINIIDNAIKFSNEKGELSVRIEQSDDIIQVKITNDGKEIKEEDRQKIFSKFYQADSSHEKEGNGIGLSIVKHIVVLHKGEVDVECENGKTSFIVKLPK